MVQKMSWKPRILVRKIESAKNSVKTRFRALNFQNYSAPFAVAGGGIPYLKPYGRSRNPLQILAQGPKWSSGPVYSPPRGLNMDNPEEIERT